MQKLIAEFIATFTLVFIGAGAVCTDATHGGLGLTGIALAHGFAIMVMVYATAHISGAHINPAVTVAMCATRRLGWGEGIRYIVSQLAGASFAAMILGYIFPQHLSAAPYLGNAMLAAGLTTTQGFLIELLATFLLVFVIFGIAVDDRGLKPAVGLAIGLTVAMDICLAGPLTGAAMNPARAFGPALITGNLGMQWLYWAGPIAGALLAAFTYDVVMRKR